VSSSRSGVCCSSVARTPPSSLRAALLPEAVLKIGYIEGFTQATKAVDARLGLVDHDQARGRRVDQRLRRGLLGAGPAARTATRPPGSARTTTPSRPCDRVQRETFVNGCPAPACPRGRRRSFGERSFGRRIALSGISPLCVGDVVRSRRLARVRRACPDIRRAAEARGASGRAARRRGPSTNLEASSARSGAIRFGCRSIGGSYAGAGMTPRA
jgi:hypothetical protein